MQSNIPKQYLRLQGRTILEHTIHRLAAVSKIKGIAIAVAKQDPYWPEQQFDIPQSVFRAEGGDERCHSVLSALDTLQSHGATANDWVLVHDAARPCVRRSDIELLMDAVTTGGQGGLLAIPVRDTMKQANNNLCVEQTVERSHLWHALTPQMFRLQELLSALTAALRDGYLVTDEASAMEYAGQQPLLVEGHSDNIKITRPEDLALAAFYLQNQDNETQTFTDGQ